MICIGKTKCTSEQGLLNHGHCLSHNLSLATALDLGLMGEGHKDHKEKHFPIENEQRLTKPQNNERKTK